jgi:hypothetical protein
MIDGLLTVFLALFGMKGLVGWLFFGLGAFGTS